MIHKTITYLCVWFGGVVVEVVEMRANMTLQFIYFMEMKPEAGCHLQNTSTLSFDFEKKLAEVGRGHMGELQ